MTDIVRRSEAYHLYTVKELLELHDDHSRWIVPHMIPRVGRTFVYGKGGEYKCRSGDQRVALANGSRVPIAELEGQAIQVLTYVEARKQIAYADAIVQRSRPSPLISFVMGSGRTHRVTPNEPMKTQRGWVRADEVTSNDFFAAMAYDPGPAHWVPLRRGEAYLLGAAVGDGASAHAPGLKITCFDAGMLKALLDFARGLGFEPTQHGDPAGGVYYLKGSTRLGQRHGLNGKGSHTKRVPREVFKATRADVAEYLGGYWDADGSCSKLKREILFTSCNRPLLEDTQSLMLRLGIPCILNVDPYKSAYEKDGRKFDYYVLKCFGRYAVQFLEETGCRSNKADKARKVLWGLAPTEYETAADRLPAELIDPHLVGCGQKFLRKCCGIALDSRAYKTRTRGWAQRLADAYRELARTDEWRKKYHRSPASGISKEEFQRRAECIEGHVQDVETYWDPIKKVLPPGELEPTWSLSCPGTETYICEDTVSHNSAILFDLCIAVAAGGQMLEQFPIQGYGPVILMSTESSIFENRLRLLAHMRARNLNPEVVLLRYGQSRLKLDKKEGFEKLAAMVDEVRPIMLVLDPYISFMSGAENNANEVAQFTDGLDYLIEKYNLSVIVIHHANKGGELRGSSAIQGWCDALLKFESDRDVKLPTFPHPVRVVHVKGEKQRNGREGLLFSAVPMHNEAVGLITFGIYADAEGAGVVIAYLKQEIYHLLRDSGRVFTKTELVSHFNCSPDKVAAAINWLDRCGLICRGMVARSTSTDGTRARSVSGWQALAGDSKVDVARVMLQTQMHGLEDDDEDGYNE